jgi:hypothetical protein
MVLVASMAFAADFAPQPTKIAGTPTLQYAFDGSNLSVPFSLTGSAALVKLAVFTKDKGDQIRDIKNGFLGWHYVDKIDTCLYISPNYSFQPGNQTIIWDGKDQDGGKASAGTYTYYIWGFDNVGNKVQAVPFSQGFGTNDEYLVWDDTGTKLAQPIYYTGKRNNSRWKLGNDPLDGSLRETCRFNTPEGWGESDYGHWLVDSQDNSVVYGRTFNSTTVTGMARKFHWVPNDVGTEDSKFGVEFFPLNNYSGCEYDDTYLYYGECNYKESVARTYLHIIDYRNTEEGEYMGYIDQTDVMQQVDAYNQYQSQASLNVLMNNGWTQTAWDATRNWMVGGVHCCGLRVACEPAAWFDDNSSDAVRWVNDNGDSVLPYGVFDVNPEPTSPKPWVVCSLGVTTFSNHGFGIDANGIVEAGQYWGVTSFHAVTPDGTGLGMHSFAGEIDVHRGGYTILDADTAYDGSYSCKAEGTALLGATFWCGRDSFMGIISQSGVSVDDDAPAAFAVAQNTPNPFNPTTTINFTLAKAGNVSVDVFNVAGQKVATLADGYRDAGAQSLVWDASSQAAGVYFYTVKSGDMSKTMKMTLIK